MRLWTLHPQLLDVKGLTAAWREALLAQAVLRGRTRGYRNHPQLIRFRAHAHPLAAINAFLWAIWQEACRRGYVFDGTKVRRPPSVLHLARIPVNRGQIAFEVAHLTEKLQRRDPARRALLTPAIVTRPPLHPLFVARAGPVEPWERGG